MIQFSGKGIMELVGHIFLVCLVLPVSIIVARNAGQAHHQSKVPDIPFGYDSDGVAFEATKNQTVEAESTTNQNTDKKMLETTSSPEELEASTPADDFSLADVLGDRTRYTIEGNDRSHEDANTSKKEDESNLHFQHHSSHKPLSELETNSATTTTTESLVETTMTSSEEGQRGRHPCQRECREGEPPMTCHYIFVIEMYYAMSKACYNCSTNSSDCYRFDCIATNGVKRPIIVVNRTLPGPSIEVCQNDRVIVDVHNHLMEETTSVHWHGHHQRGSPYMDGVPFITQCPVQPRTAFRYSYDAVNAGTHFWHSHSGCQRTDGAVGNLIIYQPPSRDPHRHLYDEDLSEHVINVMDWAHELGAAMFAAHYHSDGDNKPESILVNGRGRFFQDSNNLTATPLAVFSVRQNVRYRFRLINAGNQNCPLELYIENHTMTILNSDGSDIEPVEAATLVSYAGERWDFVLKANAPVGNYWMRFKGLMDCDERFTKAHQAAILRYDGADNEEPISKLSYHGPIKPGPKLNAMNVALGAPGTILIPELKALQIHQDPALQPVADHQFYIAYDFYPVDTPHYHKPRFYGFYDVQNRKERVYTPQFNRVSMHMPSEPLLSQRDDIDKDMFCDHTKLNNCTSQSCHCTNVIKIPLGDVVELIMIDEGHTYNANHPFHLHGHAFRVVGMDRIGESTTPEEVRALDKAGLIWRNLKTAPLKDTVNVPDGGYTIIRFHATNPGYWLFHCHLEFHVEVGMAMIFQIGEHSDFPPVPKKFPTCGDYLPSNFETNFSVLDNEIEFGDEYRNSKRSAIASAPSSMTETSHQCLLISSTALILILSSMF